MLATRFDDVFVIPLRKHAARPVARSRKCTVDDLEFSEFGRSTQQSLAWVFLALTGFWGVVTLLVLAAL
jgi:hypothetical protein